MTKVIVGKKYPKHTASTFPGILNLEVGAVVMVYKVYSDMVYAVHIARNSAHLFPPGAIEKLWEQVE